MEICFYNSKDDYIKHLNYSYDLIERFLNFLFILFLIVQIIKMTFIFQGIFMFFAFLASLIICCIFYLLYKIITKLLFSIIRKIFFENNLNKILKNYPCMIGDKIVTIMDNKLIITVNSNSIEYDYSNMIVNTTHKDLIEIAYNRKLLCPIPINVFKSVDDQMYFVNKLKSNIKTYKYKINKPKDRDNSISIFRFIYFTRGRAMILRNPYVKDYF